jgi:hypothetical protein
MADRAAKRMCRLSTENEEERTEQWMDGNIRYVADCNTHSSRQGQAGVQGVLEQQSRPHNAYQESQLPSILTTTPVPHAHDPCASTPRV